MSLPSQKSVSWMSSILTGLLLLFHLAIFCLYKKQPDSLTFLTLTPIWVWGGIGLFCSSLLFLLSQNTASLVVALIWLFTILFLSDESSSLSRLGGEKMTSHPPVSYQNQPVLRIMTVNLNFSEPPEIALFLKQYHPDIVFLQGVPHPYILKKITLTLFGQYETKCLYDDTNACAILSRGTLAPQQITPHKHALFTSVTFPGGRKIELCNLHLEPIPKTTNFLKKNAWLSHRFSSIKRRQELHSSLKFLWHHSSFPNYPAIIAGSFNTPAHGRLYRMLNPHFSDSFKESGSGWGSTFFLKNYPILRTDKIYASQRHFISLKSTTLSFPHSKHRVVISDLAYQ